MRNHFLNLFKHALIDRFMKYAWDTLTLIFLKSYLFFVLYHFRNRCNICEEIRTYLDYYCELFSSRDKSPAVQKRNSPSPAYRIAAARIRRAGVNCPAMICYCVVDDEDCHLP